MALEAARNTHARDLIDVTKLYGSRAGVLQLLARVNMGSDSVALANLGATAARNALVDLWLPTAAAKVRAVAGRDFDLHTAQVVYINGTGDDRLDLSTVGMIPLMSVTSILSGTTTLSNSNYVVGKDGWIQYDRASSAASAAEPWKNPGGAGYFPVGNQNIKVTATWGYSTVPPDIMMAGNLFCAAYVLAMVGVSDSNTDDGIPGGDVSIELGDLQVDQAKGSRYAPHVAWMKNSARSKCALYRPSIRMESVTME